MNRKIFIGDTVFKMAPQETKGQYLLINDEKFYQISNYDKMKPFFMSIVSNSDLWMFISSNGALTAGRKNADNALFPYYTDDRIHDSQEVTGSKTLVLVTQEGKTFLWEPFSEKYQGVYHLERNLFKNVFGNKLIFEEINSDLSVIFRYAWFNAEKYGFIRKAQIKNIGSNPVAVNLLDGLQNILPDGIERKFQLEYSTLADGYKKNELQADTGLGLFTLSSIPTDKAEPSEALKATTVWSVGVKDAKILLSTRQIDSFRKGLPIVQETDVRAARGAYLINSEFELAANHEKEWYLVVDTNKDGSDVELLSQLIKNNQNLKYQIEKEIAISTENLKINVASADGFQTTEDELSASRHFSNVLFNIMRGGIFDDGYQVDKSDFGLFIQKTNKNILKKHQDFFEELPDKLQHSELLKRIETLNDLDFEKLCYEYLPLTFSRRHGDPSRPWNHFSIEIKNEQGKKNLNYEGNWRDIFQNWEALAISFPVYIESMMTKFINASTEDGYNPYRITREGFDWEVLDPANPWSYIGYWGDHQIIYLAKLLELSLRYHPGRLQSFLSKDIFAYANVPYQIKSYQALIIDPKSTIDFDAELNSEIAKRVQSIGTDGKFVWNKNKEIIHVNLTEKLLVTILAKLTNFIPEAGIWLNTQRPEWNDANNALVGYGASMVTVYYLRRFLAFCINLFHAAKIKQVEVSIEVLELFHAIKKTFNEHQDILSAPISNVGRKLFLDRLGQAGSNYRNKIYADGFSDLKKAISISDILAFFELALRFIDHSIKANHREDNLYHAYNLIKIIDGKEIAIRHLYEMLEGQVAVLSSGYLAPDDSLALLDSLRKSALFRPDQGSYILYPDRQLPRFMDKNHIPRNIFEKSTLLKTLAAAGDRQIVLQDAHGGQIHFNGSFRNARILKEAMAKLKYNEKYKQLVEEEEPFILELYESVFDHQSFTGRSGTFYKYEGLGSIYWHMVAKLLLAVQETYFRAINSGEDESISNRLKAHYYEIRQGIGVHKSPELYGAFPTDPYSHTPGFTGVQQPGMTGQVKEDILSRFGELGLIVRDGKIYFDTHLLRKSEFLTKSQSFQYYDVNRDWQTLELDSGMLVYTICQVPVIYILADKSKIVITKSNGSEEEIERLELDSVLSEAIFKRTDYVKKIRIFVKL